MTTVIENSILLEVPALPGREGQRELLSRARCLPTLPGVYLMRNAGGEVIYVGKAKDLRARVKTYFLGGDGRAQIEFLLKKVQQLETIVTDTENQAFILERDLITKYKPRYNIRLKDDKAYISIRVDKNQAWPRLEMVRRIEQDGAQYFGPYSFSYELRSLLEIIRRVVPLRTCTDTVFYNRTRPCLEYQIRRCAGPCCLPVERIQYMQWVKQACAILEGRTEGLVKDLTQQMEQASEELRFEDAALIRDRMKALQSAKQNHALVSRSADDRDVFSLYREEALATLSVLRVRLGRISDNVNFSFTDVQVSDEEILEAAITQFYESGREVPPEIILPRQLANQSMLLDALSAKHGARVEITVPQRGIKARLLSLGDLNAQQHFATSFDAASRGMELSKELAKLLKLKQVPRRIECVDISNLQGSDIVGAIVVFYDGEPDKKSYKKYTLSFQDKPDDFAAMHEVVTRRLRRGFEEGDLPDLLIIDGGPGQLSKAIQAREELKLSLEIMSLAKEKADQGTKSAQPSSKKPERVYVEGAPEPVILHGASPVTHLLQRIRDEAHRFVITFHRRKRAKRALTSVLDGILGLGPERRRRLFKTFGSVAAMRDVPAEELARAGRMPLALAHKVREILLGAL